MQVVKILTLELCWGRIAVATVCQQSVRGCVLEVDHHQSVRQYRLGDLKHRLPIQKYCSHVGLHTGGGHQEAHPVALPYPSGPIHLLDHVK
jgi:hypothetical protein